MRIARAISMVTLLSLAIPQTVLAAGCEFATRSDARGLVVGLRASSGTVLRVSWGDGTVSTSSPIPAEGGRARVSHAYAVDGVYALGMQGTGPSGDCAMSAELRVPYPAVPDVDTLEVLGEGPSGRGLGDASNNQEPPSQPSVGIDVLGSARQAACGVLSWLGIGSGC